MPLTDAQRLVRRAREFTAEERAVIRERRLGWEQADCATLARIFDTTPQHIAALCRTPSSGPTAVETPATHPSPSVAGGFGEVPTVSHRKTV